MLKKISTVLGTFTLICFSFYYTDSAVDLIKQNDPIMKQIINYSENYGNTSIDSVLVNNNIIPGVKGNEVDIDKSYVNMKRVGKFDKSLMVFKDSLPTNSITDNYENYIISGNKSKNNVSILFKIDNISYVEEIISILNRKNIKVTFLLTKNIIDENNDLIKLIMINNHDIELFDDDYESTLVKKYNTILNAISLNKLSFCYTEIKKDELLNNCSKQELYTIIPSIVGGNYPYTEIKNNLSNGSIITLTNNKDTMRELSSIINYIAQRGKNIVTLKKLLEE